MQGRIVQALGWNVGPGLEFEDNLNWVVGTCFVHRGASEQIFSMNRISWDLITDDRGSARATVFELGCKGDLIMWRPSAAHHQCHTMSLFFWGTI